MATHSSVLAWRMPETMEPGWLPPMGLHRLGHGRRDLAAGAAVLFNIELLVNKVYQICHLPAFCPS